jgi:GTP:adenosylcobinamide-phosphate guanylyltransferase
MPQSKLATIVLAGGVAKPAFTAAAGVTNRALVELAPGKTMLRFVLDALAGSKTIGEIFVVGNVSELPGVSVLAPGASLIDNILIGIDASGAKATDNVLLVSSDIPFIKPDEIDSLVTNALGTGADFCYPIIRMSDYRRQFGQMKRTTLKLKEGEFTGGNIMLVRAGVITQNPDAIRSAYAARKSVTALGRMLGWGLLCRILASQIFAPNLLSIPLLESAVGKVLGGAARAVITPHPSIGTDIDDPNDVAVAREFLAIEGFRSVPRVE